MNNSIIAYTAGAIDLGIDMPNWRSDLLEMLAGSGVEAVFFDPSAAYKHSRWGQLNVNRSLYIENVNRFALDQANIFIAVVSKKTPSIGTPIEIEFAMQSNSIKHMFIITDIQAGTSVYLDNRFMQDKWFYVKDMNNKSDAQDALFKLADSLIDIVETNK